MIQLEQVTRRYRDGDRPALDDVTLTFDQGEFVFVTGPSGAGKSTLLRLLYAAERPDTGDVLIQGKSVVRLHPSSIPFLRRNIGVIFQDFKLLPRRTVFDNVALALEVCGQPRSVIGHKVLRILRRVGLEGLEGRLPGALSAGEQQRAAIARALVNEPSIVLADEPTGNLDEQLSSEIIDLLAELARERQTTVLVATHDNISVALRGFRHVRVAAGRVVSDTAARGEAVVEDPDELPDDWSVEPVMGLEIPESEFEIRRSITQPSAVGMKAVTDEDVAAAEASEAEAPADVATDEHLESVAPEAAVPDAEPEPAEPEAAEPEAAEPEDPEPEPEAAEPEDPEPEPEPPTPEDPEPEPEPEPEPAPAPAPEPAPKPRRPAAKKPAAKKPAAKKPAAKTVRSARRKKP
jgi:cell division transport system ATP-binding protein